MKDQVLNSLPDKQKKIVRATKLLKEVTVNKLNYFSDEKVFKVQDYKNSQNCRLYAPCDQNKSEMLTLFL